MLQKFPMVETLQLHHPQITPGHLLCFSSTTRLKQLCLPSCFPPHRPRLQSRDFAHLMQLTSLHLHFPPSSRATPKLLPQALLQTLRNLQHVTITGIHHGEAPFADLASLPELVSFKTDQAKLEMTLLINLRRLHITEHSHKIFYVFEQSFSALARLTALKVGNTWGSPWPGSVNEIMSLHCFPQLAELVLTGPYHLSPHLSEHGDRQRRWSALTSLTSVKHLQLKNVYHNLYVFDILGRMTQLTCLCFSSCAYQGLNVELLNESLLGLSTLTSLLRLECKAPCSIFQGVGQAHSPQLSTFGDALESSLSLFTGTCVCHFGCDCTIKSDIDNICCYKSW